MAAYLIFHTWCCQKMTVYIGLNLIIYRYLTFTQRQYERILASVIYLPFFCVSEVYEVNKIAQYKNINKLFSLFIALIFLL